MSKSKRNGSESKFYPNTAVTLESALLMIKNRNDHAGAATILSPATVSRLNNIQPLYHQARREVALKKTAYVQLTSQKDDARNDTLTYASHFLQVFLMGVKRGKYASEDRAGFGMHLSSDALPSFKGDANIISAAENVLDGEARRIALGKEAVVNPSRAEVSAKLLLFKVLSHQTANADDAYGDAQKALRSLHKEARAVVKRVWREVETHYNEGSRERMRKLAREWGVLYARKGGEKRVSGTITDAATGLPLAAAKVKFEKGKNKVITSMEGRFSFITNLLHSQKLLATRQEYEPAEIMIELKEGEENVCEMKMNKATEKD